MPRGVGGDIPTGWLASRRCPCLRALALCLHVCKCLAKCVDLCARVQRGAGVGEAGHDEPAQVCTRICEFWGMLVRVSCEEDN